MTWKIANDSRFFDLMGRNPKIASVTSRHDATPVTASRTRRTRPFKEESHHLARRIGSERVGEATRPAAA